MKKFQHLINFKNKLMIKLKKSVICYQYNKKGHYKLQCFELIREQLKNVNQIPVKKVYVKEKD